MPIFRKQPKNKRDLTFIGTGCKVEGNIEVQGELIVNGRVEGSIRCDVLHTGPNSFIKAGVEAANVTLAGICEGEMHIYEQLTISSTGKLSGKVSYGTLSVESGGMLGGEIHKAEAKAKKVVAFDDFEECSQGESAHLAQEHVSNA